VGLETRRVSSPRYFYDLPYLFGRPTNDHHDEWPPPQDRDWWGSRRFVSRDPGRWKKEHERRMAATRSSSRLPPHHYNDDNRYQNGIRCCQYQLLVTSQLSLACQRDHIHHHTMFAYRALWQPLDYPYVPPAPAKSMHRHIDITIHVYENVYGAHVTTLTNIQRIKWLQLTVVFGSSL